MKFKYKLTALALTLIAGIVVYLSCVSFSGPNDGTIYYSSKESNLRTIMKPKDKALSIMDEKFLGLDD